MPSQVVVVGSKVGLHARPASLLVKAAGSSGLSVTVGRPGEKAVNAASLLSVLAELVQIVATDHDE